MTVKVNSITKFINTFRKNGKTANEVINRANGNPVLQRVSKDGTIALQTSYIDKDTFTLITDKNIIEKVIQIDVNESSKNWRSAKTFFNRNGIDKLKTIINERLYVGKAIEEDASYTKINHGIVSYIVKSAADRTTKFPQTVIAKNMRPANMEIYKHLDGRITYMETHPFN